MADDEDDPSSREISKCWLAMKALERHDLDECLEHCNAALEKNPYDQVRRPRPFDADFQPPCPRWSDRLPSRPSFSSAANVVHQDALPDAQELD